MLPSALAPARRVDRRAATAFAHSTQGAPAGHRRCQAQRHAKLPLHQILYDSARPQPKVEPVLQRVLAIDPAKHFSLLGSAQLFRAPACLARGQRTHTSAAPRRRFHPTINYASMKSVAGNHRAGPLAFANTLHRHLADFFQRPVIHFSPVSLHAAIITP